MTEGGELAPVVAEMTSEQFSRFLMASESVDVSAPRLLVIDESRLELCLMRHEKSLEPRLGWTTPLALLLTALVALLTSAFRDFLGFPAAAWQALFMIVLAISGFWLAWALIRLLSVRQFSIADIVAEVRKESRRLTRG
jgi:hypothetical protein